MLSNERLQASRFSDIVNPDAERLLNNFNNNSNARELARLVAIGIGVPIDHLYEVHSIGPIGVMCLMYMYEDEYCGSRTRPSVWGEDYTRGLLSNGIGGVGRVSLWFRDNISPTDILSISCTNAIDRGSWFVFDRILTKYTEHISNGAFSSYVGYLVDNGWMSPGQMQNVLTRLNNGHMLKAIMDTLNSHKSGRRTRDLLVELRERSDFNQLCQHVTLKIAEALTPVVEEATT